MGKLSRAEIQRHYRQRRDADPERRRDHLLKRKEQYDEAKAVGKRKLIGQLDSREKRLRRRNWRHQQQKSRQRKKEMDRLILHTPPASPDADNQIPGTSGNPSAQMRYSNKMLRKKLRDVTKQNERLQVDLRKKDKLANKYRMRINRMSNPNRNDSTSGREDTPRTRTRKLLQNLSKNKQLIKKQLTFHFSIISTIAKKYANTTSYRKKQLLFRRFCNNLLKKYRLQSFAQKELNVSQRVWPMAFKFNLTKKISSAHLKIQQQLRNFYIRDDVSRVVAGKKQTVTKNKVKLQRRILSDSLLNLHLKFISEHQNISYSTFCKYRPFWVLPPKASDRNTCQCKIHENIQFISDKLKGLGYLDTSDCTKLLKSVMCDEKSEPCAYQKCETCQTKKVDLIKPLVDGEVSYTQWQTSINSSGSKVTSKVTLSSSLIDLYGMFMKQMSVYKRHIFNIRHQYGMYRRIREGLSDSECLIHIDFSENFTCQYANEVQSVHFGGSHQQASLHTGMLYTKTQSKGFCTISDSRQHDPPAIWAHLHPILTKLRHEKPEITKLYFFSDGPTTQYRQKVNFYLLTEEPYNYGFTYVNWNLFESSHGKGAPDGIGGSLKRTADSLIRHGKDIPDAKSFFDRLSESGTQIDLFYVPDGDVLRKTKELDEILPQLRTIKGTMRLHQLISPSRGDLFCRDLSCICGDICECFNIRKARVILDVRGNISESDNHTVSNHISCDAISASSPQNIPSISSMRLNEYCLVEYFEEAYIGTIVAISRESSEITVKCMKCIGENKFIWPDKEDICQYTPDDIISLIAEPIKSGRRFYSVSPEDWKVIQSYAMFS